MIPSSSVCSSSNDERIDKYIASMKEILLYMLYTQRYYTYRGLEEITDQE